MSTGGDANLDFQRTTIKVEEESKTIVPGCRLEARDFDGSWYSARVEQVDWEDRKVLVHFDKWSCKFDEWVSMDSNRLRSIQQPQPKKAKVFSRGDSVLAMWSAYQKYPAVISRVLPDGKYEVLFEDGFVKRLPSGRVWKLDSKDVREKPAQTVTDAAGIGSKQDRRDRKRRFSGNVADLLRGNKRPASSTAKRSSEGPSATVTLSQHSKVAAAVLKEPTTPAPSSSSPLPGPPSGDAHPNELRPPEEIEVEYLDGTKEKWTKVLTRRSEGKTAGRLDIVIASNSGRKFRTRTEVIKFCEERKIRYDPVVFDFSAKNRPRSQTIAKQSPVVVAKEPEVVIKPPREPTPPPELPLPPELPPPPELPCPPVQVPPLLEPPPPVEPPSPVAGPSLVETPSVQAKLPPVPSALTIPVEEPIEEEAKKYIGNMEIVVLDGQFICPVDDCRKHFRKENLLYMHMKHYHPDLCKYLDYTPSVTDLAYARTASSGFAVEVASVSPRPVARRSLEPKRASYGTTKECRVALIRTENSDLMQQAQSHISDVKTMETEPPVVEDVKPEVKPVVVEESVPSSPLTQKLLPIEPKEESPATSAATAAAEDTGDLVQRNPILNNLLARPAVVAPRVRWRPHWRRGRRFSRHRRLPLPRPPRPPTVAAVAEEESVIAAPPPVEPSTSRCYADKVEKLRRHEIINCICQMKEEDGLMIQCDICLCWQHGHCLGMSRQSNVPETYICTVCKNPYKGRSSQRYLNHQTWMKEGTLPSLPYAQESDERREKSARQQAMLKRSFELSGQLTLLTRLLHSLKTRVSIAKHKDHPKLWMWANSTTTVKTEDPRTPKVPEPEKPIDSVECRLNLLTNVEQYQEAVQKRLDAIEAELEQLEAIEAELDGVAVEKPEEPQSYAKDKATVIMLKRDLDTLEKFSKLP